ncbi:cache and HAMP domain-containing protein [bacterium]|nr:cache and HAMP domain-containing protein [bacterium]
MLFFSPVHDFVESSKIEGFIAAKASLDGTDIQEILNAFPTHGKEYMCVLNSSGTILFRRGEGILRTARAISLPASIWKQLSGGIKTITVEVTNKDHDDLLSVTFSPIIEGYICFGQPSNEAFSLVQKLQGNFWVIVAFAFVLSLAGSVLIGQTVSKPIIDLTDGIRKVQEGVLSHRVPVHGNDELSEAAKAVNSLSESLGKKNLISAVWDKLRSGPEGK